jgi:hypothetical protein
MVKRVDANSPSVSGNKALRPGLSQENQAQQSPRQGAHRQANSDPPHDNFYEPGMQEDSRLPRTEIGIVIASETKIP